MCLNQMQKNQVQNLIEIVLINYIINTIII